MNTASRNDDHQDKQNPTKRRFKNANNAVTKFVPNLYGIAYKKHVDTLTRISYVVPPDWTDIALKAIPTVLTGFAFLHKQLWDPLQRIHQDVRQ